VLRVGEEERLRPACAQQADLGDANLLRHHGVAARQGQRQVPGQQQPLAIRRGIIVVGQRRQRDLKRRVERVHAFPHGADQAVRAVRAQRVERFVQPVDLDLLPGLLRRGFERLNRERGARFG